MIVLDASVIIAHLGDDAHAEQALEILDTEDELAIHPLTLAECLVGPARLHREAEAMATIERLGIELAPCPVGQPLAIARLRATSRLKLPDCCVLVSALQASATVGTFDTTLARAATRLALAVLTTVATS